MIAIPLIIWLVIFFAIFGKVMKGNQTKTVDRTIKTVDRAMKTVDRNMNTVVKTATKIVNEAAEAVNQSAEQSGSSFRVPPMASSAQDREPEYARPVPKAATSSSSRNKSINRDLQARSEQQKVKSERRSPMMSMDDRSNDWLAHQLREEDRIYRRGSDLDLGASHQSSCEADEIKRSHEKAHGRY